MGWRGFVSAPSARIPSGWDLQELEQAIASFESIQADLNYQRAQSALRRLVRNLDLRPEERTGLEADIGQLTALLDKLERASLQIAAVGAVGRGKSALLNALLGEAAFQTGPLHGVTQAVASATWQQSRQAAGSSDREVIRLTRTSSDRAQIELVDTPGLDEIDGEAREALTHQIAQQADLILFVVAGDLTQLEYDALRQLRASGKPILLAFNKIDQYAPADRDAIYRQLRDERLRGLLAPEEIVTVAADPLATEAVRQPDGSLHLERRRGAPQVEALRQQILALLEREGKSLVALNTMLYADGLSERLTQRKMVLRAAAADELIRRGALTKATVVALNPVTAIDLLTGSVVDVATILALARLYGIPMTQQAAVGLLQQIAVSMGGIGAGDVLGTLGLSSLKGVLGISVPASGGAALAPYASVAVTQAGVAGVSAYAIGHASKTYLANGASWGRHGPKAAIAAILDSLDERSILHRIKQDLGERLNATGRPTPSPSLS